MSEATVIRPEYEAELRQMVRALEDAAGLHSRWVACSTLQATADTAIGELLSTVDAVRAERDTAAARAEAAEQRAEAAESEGARLRVLGPDTAARVTDEARRIAAEALRPTVDAWRAEVARVAAERDEAAAAAGAAAAIARTAQAEVERLGAELAQARADRALLAGLWLATAPPDVLPALLPTDPGERERLVAVLGAVDLQPGVLPQIVAGRAVIARIVAEMGGGAA